MSPLPKLDNEKTGVLAAIGSGVAFGFLGLFGKAAYEAGAKPGEFLSIRFFLSAMMLLAFFLVRKPRALLLPARIIFRNMSLGLFGYAVFSFCFFSALSRLSASVTVLLLYLYPVFVTLGAFFILGEKMSRRSLLALPLALFGLVGLVANGWEVASLDGFLFGLGSAIFYSAYILTSRVWLRGQDVLAATFYIQLSAGVCLGLLHFSSLARPIELLSRNAALFFGVSFLCSLVAMSLFLSAVQKIAPQKVSILSMSEPLTGILLAFIFLGERLSLIQIGGAVLVCAAFVLVSLKEEQA